MKSPHYLRFVKALVLTAAIPACSSDASPAPAPAQVADTTATAPPAVQPIANEELADTTPTSDAGQTDADVDAKLPFASGPLLPPELPVGFA